MLHLGGLPRLAGSLRDKGGRVKNADLDCARLDRRPPDSSTELEGEARKGVESGHAVIPQGLLVSVSACGCLAGMRRCIIKKNKNKEEENRILPRSQFCWSD